jgi:hypothetical protein
MRLFGLLLLAGCSSAANNGICRAPTCTPIGAELGVEVTPSDQALAPFDDVGLTVDGDGILRLTLVPRVTLSGTVKFGSPAAPAPGIVLATRPSRIVGRPDISFQGPIDANGNFSLAVSPTHSGEKYTVRYVAHDATTLPPVSASTAVPDDTNLNLMIPPLDNLKLISGTVVNPLQQPIANITVQALDGSGDVVSSTAVTGTDGTYVLLLAPDFSDNQVHISATPTDPTQPTLDRLITITSKLMGDITLPMPALPTPVHVGYHIWGMSPSGATVSVAGARCRFTSVVSAASDPTGTTALYQTNSTTGSDGKVVVDLIPADPSSGVTSTW